MGPSPQNLYPKLIYVETNFVSKKCCSKNNDHLVPFHYGSPCTLSLWTTPYPSVVKVGPMN